jgi:hypothetical protein
VLIAGATANSYTPKPEDAQTAGDVLYTREVKDGACAGWTLSANTYTLTVTAAPAVTLQTPTVTACNAAGFSVAAASGSANSYAWEEYVNGAWTNMGVTAQTLTVTGGKAVAGEYYYRAKLNVTNNGGCTADIYSDAATVTVREAFNAGSFTVSEGAVCVGMQPQAITGVSAPTGGSGDYTYQWDKGGSSLGTSATAATYQPQLADAATTGVIVYTRRVIDKLCGEKSTAASFTLNVGGGAAPTIDIVPVNTTICYNEPSTLTAGTVANAQTYKWESSGNGLNWTDLPDNSKDLTVAGKTTPGAYYYRVTVTTSEAAPCNVVTSTPSTVTVYPELWAGEFIVNTGSICVNALPAAISGNVTDPTGGDGNYSYQWYQGSNPIPGATAASYQPGTFPGATTAVYTRGVKDGSCSTASYTPATGSYTLTVGAAGTQTTNLTPAAQGVCGGFDITALEPADALGYTWKQSVDGANWDAVSGQNTNILNIASGIAPGIYYYKVDVLSAGTCAPVITSTPATVTVYNDFDPGALGGTTYTETCMRNLPSVVASVTAPAGGSGSFAYQWYKDGTPIAGATDAAYQPVTSDVAVAGTYTYTRQVIDVACSDSKFSAGSYILMVNKAENVNVTPSASIICYNGSFTIGAALSEPSATATGYAWESRANSEASWTSVSGMTTATLTVSPATATAQYRVLVSVQGETCQGISDAVTINVAAPFTPGTITTAEHKICDGGTPEEITSIANADGGLGANSYQWYENGSPVVSGGDKASYTPKPITTGTFVYTRKVTNSACANEAYSEGTYTLRVMTIPTVTVADVNGCAGGATLLTATVTGESDATYNWQYSDGLTWPDVKDGVPANATYTSAGQTLTVSGVAAGTYNYRVEMKTGLSGCENVLSNGAKLMISPLPVGGTVGVAAVGSICASSTTTLTLSNYQGTTIAWQEHNGNGNWALINGATTPQIQVSPVSAGTWYYRAVVSNIGCSDVYSTPVEVYVLNSGKGGQITLTGDPYLCTGQSRSMQVAGWEGDLQWQRSVDGAAFINVPGATSNSHTSEADLAAGKKYRYRVRATTPSCTATPSYSDTVELRMYAKSQGGTIVSQNGASSVTMCYGSGADLKLLNYIGESFKWIYQDVQGSTYNDLPNSSNADTYTLSTLGQGTYNIRVIVSGGCPEDTSSAMKVVVKAPVNITLSVDGSAATALPNFCKGNELVLKVGGLPDASATWTGTITSGMTTDSYTGTGGYWRVNTAVPATGTYTYAVTYTSDFCTPSQAGPITVDYRPAPDAGTLTPPVMEFCHGDTAPQTFTLSGFTGGNTTIKRWEYKALSTNPGAGSWTPYPPGGSSTTATVTPSLENAYVFRVAVESSDATFGACTTTYSNEAQVIMYAVPTIDGQDESYTNCEKADVQHSFTGSAGAAFTWEKKVNGAPSETGVGDIKESLVYTGQNNAPQTITYTVTPAVGTKQCKGTSSKTITYVLWPKFDVTFDVTNSITELSCHGATEGKLIYTAASPATFTLLKSDGSQAGPDRTGTAATFTDLGMGTYTLKIDNGVCVTTEDNIEIKGPSSPLTIINEQGSNPLCYGESTGAVTFEITGGTTPYKAAINNGAYVDGATSFSGLVAGVYSVKVQDAKGCITEKTITVESRPQLLLNVLSITPVSAAGAHDATATLQATGGSGSDYHYSATGLDNDFSSGNVVGGLSEGMNYVYAKDGHNCMASVPIEIGKYPDDGSTVTISLTATVTKPLTCDVAADAEITVQAFGSSGYMYSKNGTAFNGSNVLSGFGAGVHTITVKDAAGHVATIDVTVDQAAPLTFTATVTKQLSGLGVDDAEVTLNIIGDPAKFEYRKNSESWASTNVFGGLAAGTYAFTVHYKGATGCEATPIVVGVPGFAPSTITPHVGITASITRALVCEGDVNAEITVTASGGDGTYSFTNNNGTAWTTSSTATVHVFVGLSAGTYDLKVQSGTDYSSVIQLVVGAATPRPVITKVTPTATTCGNNNGSVEITATGGVGALGYSLSGVQWSSDNKITGLSAGNYDVLVKDGRGCTSNLATPVTVAAIQPVTFDITSVKSASAPAAVDGQIALSIAGGQSPYTLSLNNGAYSGYATSNTYTFNAIEAGLYTLTVTDASGCVAAKSVLVGATGADDIERLSVTYTTQDPTCHSATDGRIIVTAWGGSGTYTYSLDDKTYAASSTLTGLPAGTYVVYVKDNAAQPQKAYVPNVVLKGKEALSFTVTVVQNLSSPGASDAAILITAKGGTAPYQYNVNASGWKNSGYVAGLPAGEYEIVVADDKGCNVSGKIQITAPVPGEDPSPAISVSIINEPACFGGNDGAIAVTASGGRSPYAYSVDWVNWTNNNIITGLAAGTYTVYVKELSLGRITTGPEVILNNPARLTAAAVITAVVTAPGAADGAVRIDAAGGSLPYQYSVDAQNTYQYGNTFTGLQAQFYTFYVKDGKGCVVTADIKLAEQGGISMSAQVTKPVSCYGGADGEIVITASGGSSPYQYRWGDMPVWNSSATLTGVAAGVHDVFVKDNSGNEASLSMFIPQPMMLAVTVQVTALPTGNNADGAIAIVASGGSGNYTYKVGAQTYAVAAVNGLAAGNYTVEVTDANGCTASTSIHLAIVDVIVSKTVINLQKGHTAETYTVRLASAPQGNVTVGISDPNSLVAITPSTLIFTPNNWGEQQVGVAIAPGVGSLAGGVTYFTTKVQNRVMNTSAQGDAAYMNLVREVIVNITDDGGLNCTEFENAIPDIAVNGTIMTSPFAICTSDKASYVLTTSIHGSGITYRWLKDNFLEVSATASYKLSESGTYTVTVMNDRGCKVVSDPFVVNVETAPDVPVILGDRVVRQGQERNYKVKDAHAKHNVNYKWIIPSGYSLGVGSFDTDPGITLKIGSTSSILRVVATNQGNNSGACASVEGRLDIEVRTTYDVDVFPTVASNSTPLRIVPKNMLVNSIAVINTVGESYAYRILSGKLALVSGEEMQIMVNGLSSGHYFIIFYGREQSEDGNFNGRSVVHTEHIVIKN